MMVREQFRIVGRVGHPVFGLWIARHAARLGLEADGFEQGETWVKVVVTGPPELLDAMELGCSLGPCEVWVDRIERRPVW
jgi:acylphosphatase